MQLLKAVHRVKLKSCRLFRGPFRGSFSRFNKGLEVALGCTERDEGQTMKRYTTVGMMLAASALLLAGCEANTRVEVRPPAALPAPQTPAINVKEVFPLQDNPVFYTSLRVDPRP